MAFEKDTTNWGCRSKNYNDLQWVKSSVLDQNLLNAIGCTSNKNCIDIGSGPGNLSQKLYSLYKGGEYYCLDSSLEMLNIIDNDSLNKIHSSIEDLDGFDDCFDVAIAKMVAHHIPDIAHALKKINSILKDGGKLFVCEGHPPNRHCVDFYTEMFSYKEVRHTLTIDDIIFSLNGAGFRNLNCQSLVLKKMSLLNWIGNSGVEDSNKQIIYDLHKNASSFVKESYNMEYDGDDILMDWYFSIISAEK